MSYATVRAATAGELTNLRKASQWSRLFLAIHKPNTIYTATLSSVPSPKDRVVEIAFTGGAGTLANVRPHMTLYVGTTAGAYDLGVARIRKAPIAGTFYIGEESEIDWQTSCHLTVVDEFDLWARHINTVSDTEFYMDTDVAYTNQNSVFDPVPVMGSHRVLHLTGATVNTQFDWSNSWVIGSTISAYLVEAPGSASITNSTTATPTVTFDAAGWYPVYLTVTAASGKTHTGVRYVYVYDDDNPPAKVFQLESCSADYETGGWSFDVTMQADIALADAPERALCLLFAEDHYGDTEVSMGQVAGSENIVCVGKIAEEHISIDPEQSEIGLRIEGMQYWLQKVYAFPTGVLQTTTTPTNWAEMQDPTVDKVVWRLLHWGSTATTIMDVYPTNDTRLAAELVSPASNLWAQMQELAFATIYARTGVDRYSRLFIETEPQLVVSGSRTWATVMTLTKKDWQERVSVERVVVSSTGMVNASGVVIDSNASGGAFFSLSPGHVFKRYGSAEVIDRLLLSTQLQSNQFTGLLLGWRNNPYPSTEMALSANNRMIDCFPRQKLAWSISTGDTPRAFTLSGNFIPRRVEFSWDAESNFMSTSLSMELESVVQLYTDGDIPGASNPYEDLTSSPPPIPAFPKLPPFVIVGPLDIEPATVNRVLLHTTDFGFLYSANFDAATPNWVAVNGGLAAGYYNLANWCCICPNGVFYIAYVPQAGGFSFLARATSVGANFSILYESSGDVNHVNYLWGVGYNKDSPEQIGFVRGAQNANKFYVGANGSWTTGISLNDNRIRDHGISYGANSWVLTNWNQWIRTNAAGTSTTGTGTPSLSPGHLRAGVTGITYHRANGAANLQKGENNMATVTTVYNGSVLEVTPYADCDPTGQYIMTRALAGVRARSTDFGSTWLAMPNLPAGNWWFAYAGSIARWVAAGGTSVRLSLNSGGTWNGKEGDLGTVAPFCDINLVKWIG